MEGDLAARVFAAIDAEELIRLAISMGRVEAPIGSERPLADFLTDWLAAQGFRPIRMQAAPERDNVVAVIRGTGGGRRLIFNAHMDTDRTPQENVWITRYPERAAAHAWAEGDRLFGRTVLNDRGAMASFLISACALRRAGVDLAGDLVLKMVVGETDQAPVDEFQGPAYEGNGSLGTQFLLQRGVLADYAVVAETTGFAPIYAECGFAFFKLTVYGDAVYTPRIRREDGNAVSGNAVTRMAHLILRLEEWIQRYEMAHSKEFRFGPVIPRASVNAVRGGLAYRTAIRAGVCSCYLDVRIPPGMGVAEVQQDLGRFVEGLGLEAEVELYSGRRGYVAERVEPLLDAVRKAHRAVFGDDPGVGTVEERSMWRDINIYNEWGIPALTYGPPRRVLAEGAVGDRGPHTTDDSGQVRYFQKDDLVNAARVYALTAVELCGLSRA